MAVIKEFSGYRYDTEKCADLKKVMAVPYDVMNDEQRDEFYNNSEYNIARISNGKIEDNDNDENNRYKKAENFFEQWIKDGVLKKETKPAMYLYEQHSIYKNTVFVNHGVVVLLKLEELDGKGSIKVCEEMKSDFMEDRLKLLSNVKANVDMIHCMYIDSERPLTHLMNEISEETPDIGFEMRESVTDENTQNRLWVIDNENVIKFIKDSLKKTELIITEGQNRYRAALKYMKECRDKNPDHTGEEPYNYVMAFLNNAYGDNLVQIPIHRVIKSEKKFSQDYFIACAQDHFKVEKIIIDTSNDDLIETMKKQIETSRRKCIIGVYFGGNYFYRLTLTDEAYIKNLLPTHSDEYCMLDVTVLNNLLLGEILNIDKDNSEEYVSFTKRTTNGVKWVNDGEATCLFVLNASKAERIFEVVESGETMPEHSIYIFPRAVTGVVINRIDE